MEVATTTATATAASVTTADPPKGSWHPHVYGKPRSTPFSIADILGSVKHLKCNSDQPLNLSTKKDEELESDKAKFGEETALLSRGGVIQDESCRRDDRKRLQLSWNCNLQNWSRRILYGRMTGWVLKVFGHARAKKDWIFHLCGVGLASEWCLNRILEWLNFWSTKCRRT